MANIAGGAGYDVLDGSSVDDIIVGYGYNDALYGYEGNDFLVGDSGSDPAGNDYLFGGPGQDTLTGGAGDDYLDGAFNGIKDFNYTNSVDNVDILTGGAGHDTFVLGNSSGSYYENLSGRIGFATITDFNTADDYIQLSGISEQYSLSSGTFGNYGFGTFIYANTNSGQTTSDLIAFVQGVSDLEPSRDFVFV